MLTFKHSAERCGRYVRTLKVNLRFRVDDSCIDALFFKRPISEGGVVCKGIAYRHTKQLRFDFKHPTQHIGCYLGATVVLPMRNCSRSPHLRHD